MKTTIDLIEGQDLMRSRLWRYQRRLQKIHCKMYY